MTHKQKLLFGSTDAYGGISANQLARKDGPDTSKASAQEIVQSLPELHAWTVKCVTETPGKTQMELGTIHCPGDPRKIGRRLSECVKRGLLREGEERVCSKTGRKAKTYWPA